jgi:hypothetical protein
MWVPPMSQKVTCAASTPPPRRPCQMVPRREWGDFAGRVPRDTQALRRRGESDSRPQWQGGAGDTRLGRR